MKPTKKQSWKKSSFNSKRPEKRTSGAKAHADFAGVVQGLKSLPPSELKSSKSKSLFMAAHSSLTPEAKPPLFRSHYPVNRLACA